MMNVLSRHAKKNTGHRIYLLAGLLLIGFTSTSCASEAKATPPLPTLLPTPTLTLVPSPTGTPTATATSTSTATATPTLTPTNTLTPSMTPTWTLTPITTPTETKVPVTAAPTKTSAPVTVAVTVVSSDNLIANPSFEDGGNKETGDLTVPIGWHAWSSCSGVIHSELEAHPPHVRSGSFSARVWQPYNICQMGFYQQVNVTSGKSYLFTAYGFSWSTGNPVVGSLSEANINMRVGIDPNGGTDPLAASIVWSDARAAMDAYSEFKIAATAKSNVITVVLRSVPDWGMARNDTFWDETSLLLAKK